MTVATPSLRQARADVLDELLAAAGRLEHVAHRMVEDPRGWFDSLDPLQRSTLNLAVYYAALTVADRLTTPPPEPADRN